MIDIGVPGDRCFFFFFFFFFNKTRQLVEEKKGSRQLLQAVDAQIVKYRILIRYYKESVNLK